MNIYIYICTRQANCPGRVRLIRLSAIVFFFLLVCLVCSVMLPACFHICSLAILA